MFGKHNVYCCFVEEFFPQVWFHQTNAAKKSFNRCWRRRNSQILSCHTSQITKLWLVVLPPLKCIFWSLDLRNTQVLLKLLFSSRNIAAVFGSEHKKCHNKWYEIDNNSEERVWETLREKSSSECASLQKKHKIYISQRQMTEMMTVSCQYVCWNKIYMCI